MIYSLTLIVALSIGFRESDMSLEPLTPITERGELMENAQRFVRGEITDAEFRARAREIQMRYNQLGVPPAIRRMNRNQT